MAAALPMHLEIGYPKYLRIGTFIIAPVIPIGAEINPDIKPSITFGEVVLDHINVKRKIKGKANWDNVTAELYDPVTPSGAQAVMEWVRLSHESVTGRDGYSDFYKKDLFIRTLGPVGDVVEEWILKGAYCQNANFGSMDWTSDTPANISMTIVMDYAILNY